MNKGVFLKLSFWFRSCAVCSSLSPPVKWLCKTCWKKLRGFYLPPKDMIRSEGELTHIRLLDWGQENDFFLRRLLSGLKGGSTFATSFVFQKMAEEFLHRLLQMDSLFLDQEISLIPAPPASQKKFRDHAFFLAKSFSHLTAWQVKTPLIRPSRSLEKAQKQKDRQERSSLSFELKEKPNLKGVIFVDDILTTGATAQGAFEALGKPKPFWIFTLSHRLVQAPAFVSFKEEAREGARII